MSKLRILIIEDQENWQNQLGKLVPRLGLVDCDVASDFETAANYIDTRKYDIAVVDLLLATGMAQVGQESEIDLKLLKAIRESQSNRSCGVIVLSGYGNTARTRQALREYGAYDFIEKDQFNAAHFLNTVRLALFDARRKVGIERDANRYRFDVQLGHEKLLGCQLTGPDRRSTYAARDPSRIEITDLARRADNLNLLILKGGPKVWRPEGRSIGKSAYGMLAQDQRVLGDLRAAQALAQQTDDLWLEFSGPATSLGVPFELLHDEDYLTFAHMMTRRLVLQNPTPLRKVEPFHALVGKLVNGKTKARVLVVGSNSDGRIPAADSEAEALGGLIENELKQIGEDPDVTVLKGAEAEYEHVRDALAGGEYQIFHYAGHGRFNDEIPEISGLVLRDGQKLRTITAAELNLLVRNTSLSLVYLSCCFGARSEAQTGRGDFSGMLEALARADVPMVLGYRWTVADAPAMLIAQAFYRSLWRDLSPGDALPQGTTRSSNLRTGTR